ncbi:MAG: response regulator [Gammaproteobacteria bacterium]|nr:response regulator [Gammaproteobacteria bacterium]
MDNQGNVVTTPQHWRRLQIRIALLFSLVLLLVVGALSTASNAFIDLYLFETIALLLLFMGAIGLLVWYSVREIVLEPLQQSHLQQTQQIEKANQARDDFMATMSHELRTSLTVMLGSGELLAKSDLNLAQQQLLSSMDLSGRSLLYLINDILDISKIESGSCELHLAPFSMVELITEMEKIFPRRASDAGITFSATTYSEFENFLIGDMPRIRQIMLNLCGNAVKFTGEGEVRLSVGLISPQGSSEEQCWVRLVVEDDGIGMPPEVVEKLFKPFQQADSSISRRHGGTGLGLHIIWKMIQLMGGEVRVESSDGIGSRFEVDLPLQQGEPLGEEEASGEDEVHYFRGHVLVAEDTREVQLLVRQILEGYGIEVEIAENGQEALEKGLSKSYDLILMDMQMPVMDGIEATTLLRQSFCQVPIVALTANVMQVHRNKFSQAGCNDFLSKPIEQEALQRVLGEYLERVSAEEAAELTDYSQEMVVSDELKQVFLESTSQRQLEIQEALKSSSWDKVRAAAHNIKGSAANFGYPELTDLARVVCDSVDQLRDDAEIAEETEALNQALTNALNEAL